MRRTSFAVTAALLTSVLMAGCGDDGSEAAPAFLDELEAVGLGKYLSRGVPRPADDDAGWQRYDYAPSEGGPVCLHGDPYKLYVRPGTRNKVLLYLEGGGGCSSDESCNVRPTAKDSSDLVTPLATLNGAGVISTEGDNPYGDWHVVYAPYCDGGAFASDNVVDYASGRVYHRGLANLSAVVDVIQARFPDPDEITVSGSSAGGYGTFTAYGVLRLTYPGTPMLVLSDGGLGLRNDDEQGRQEREENLRSRDIVVPSCTACADQLTYLIDWWLERDPLLRVGMFSHLQDFIVARSLGLSGPEYEDLIRKVTDEIQMRHPGRFKRFLPAGQSHTILRGIGLSPAGLGAEGNIRTIAIDGTVLIDWIADFIADGPNWRDLVAPETGSDG